MNMQSYIRFRTAWLLFGTFAPILLAALCAAQDTAKPDKPETAAKQYKNIQVLKNLPADHLLPLMQAFDASLGVKCTACHVVNADHTGFEKDDKEMKQTARKMILLVEDLNKRQKVLKGQATCFMCHHGQQQPQFSPPAGGPPQGEPARKE